MRLLVTGSRDWPENESDYIYRILNMYHLTTPITDLIEGGASGVDTIAAKWARFKGIYKDENHYPADWRPKPGKPVKYRRDGTAYDPSAGPTRNQQMLDEGYPDMVIAFSKNIETSRGTADMVRRARKAGLKVEIYP